MANRATREYVSNVWPKYFIGIIAIGLPVTLAFTSYAGLFCILVGLLFSEIATSREPKIAHTAEFYSAEETSTLESISAKQEQLREQKKKIYLEAHQLGLAPRSQNQNRFDERKLASKRINSKLDSLDAQFTNFSVASKNLRASVWSRRDSWSEKYADWWFRSSIRSAFRVALFTYLAVKTVLLIDDRNVSVFSTSYVSSLIASVAAVVKRRGSLEPFVSAIRRRSLIVSRIERITQPVAD